MHTIALISRKGGTGKSTLAIGLAVAATEAGHKVCLLEADPLGTVSNWRRRRTSAEPAVETVHDGYVLFHRVQALAHRGVTLTIVDTAGGWSDASRGAMAAADFCLIPARPSPADIEAAAPTLAAVRESGKPFAFVLNQVQARSTRLNGAAGSLGERAVALKMADVLALPAIVLRNDQQDAVGVGLGVTEYAPRGKSAEEIRGLWQWVWARLSPVSRYLDEYGAVAFVVERHEYQNADGSFIVTESAKREKTFRQKRALRDVGAYRVEALSSSLRGSPDLVLAPVNHHDGRSLRREALRRREAEAARCAGDDGYPSVVA